VCARARVRACVRACRSADDIWLAHPQGGNDYDKATAYIEKQFLKKNGEVKTRFVYTHLTCATDTKNIEVVFNSVVDIFLSKLLNQVGF
jgi:hypothetical protein